MDQDSLKSDKMFSLKKWNAVAMWSWDVECDTCAICRVQVMGKFPINLLTIICPRISLVKSKYFIVPVHENKRHT